jgi:aerobic carbon-monoxide dehydrogenase medium subunit
VKPAPFAYERPASLDEALAVLAEHGDEAVPLAGGQSLVPMMNLRLAQPATVVDLNEVPGLDGIEERDGMLVIGAMARQRDVERSPVAGRLCPLLAAALHHVGNPQTRNRGTLGGNLAHADPTSEVPTVIAACGGEIVLTSAGGSRAVGAGEFFLGPYMTGRLPGELLTEVRIPALGPGRGWAFEELSWSFTAHPIVAVSAVAGPDGVRAAVAGVEGTPRVVSDAAELADVDDPHRRAAAADLVRRTMARAVERG